MSRPITTIGAAPATLGGAAERLDLVAGRLTCRREGHMWDSDRPSGALHERDFCWRCGAVCEGARHDRRH